MESASCLSVGEFICVRRNGHFWDWRSNPYHGICLGFLEDYIFESSYLGRTRDTDGTAHVLWRVQRWVKLGEDSHDQSYRGKKSNWK